MPKDPPGFGLGKKILYGLVHERKKLEKSILLLENVKRNLHHGYTVMESEICQETGVCPDDEDEHTDSLDIDAPQLVPEETPEELGELDPDAEL